MDTLLRERLLGIYAQTKRIAVVGASADPSKPAHQIPRYLQQQGYRILPVNPRGGQLLNEPVARSLFEVEGPVDVVEVFVPLPRRPRSPVRRSRSTPRCCGCSWGSPLRRPGRWPRRRD